MPFSSITYNDVSTSSFDPPIYIETPPKYSIPEVDSITEHVPGRNGDVVIQIEGYKNVKREYEINSGEENGNFREIVRNIIHWANSAGGGYAPLYDSFDQEHICYARFTGGVTVDNILNQAAKVKISFDCKPQNYIASSLQNWEMFGGASYDVLNPTSQIAKPLFRFIPGASQSSKINITLMSSGVEDRTMEIDRSVFVGHQNAWHFIDCENMVLYRGTDGTGDTVDQILPNSVYKTGDNYFLDFGPGTTNIIVTGIGAVGANEEVTIGVKCRWWDL